jgi:hypothetical protein
MKKTMIVALILFLVGFSYGNLVSYEKYIDRDLTIDGNQNVIIDDGYIDTLYIRNNASVLINSVNSINEIEIHNNSSLLINSIDSINEIKMYNNSFLQLNNADDTLFLGLYNNAKVEIVGTNIQYFTGVKGFKIITGQWENGIDANIIINYDHNMDNVSFIEIPDVPTMLLLGIGCMLINVKKVT